MTSSTVVSRATSNTQSVMDALVRGTRMASPLSLPLSSGKMSAMAVAEPVLVGTRLLNALRPRQAAGGVGAVLADDAARWNEAAAALEAAVEAHDAGVRGAAAGLAAAAKS